MVILTETQRVICGTTRLISVNGCLSKVCEFGETAINLIRYAILTFLNGGVA